MIAEQPFQKNLLLNTELTGTYITQRQRFENETCDVIVGEIETKDGERVTIKGEANLGDLQQRMTYRFFGKFRPYKNRHTGETEQQFCFDTFAICKPAGREAIIAYLIHHGAGCGLGRVRATKLWELFGEEAVELARKDPILVADALTKANLIYRSGDAGMLSRSLQQSESSEAIRLELTGLLQGRGFGKGIVNQVIARWGNRAAEIIRRNPYRLMFERFPGCGFKRCDAMYLDLGLPAGALKRQAICAWYSLARNTDGHTWFSWKVIDAFLRTNIGAAEVNVNKAITLTVRAGLLAEMWTDGEHGPITTKRGAGCVRWFAESDKAKNERTIAECVLRAEQEQPSWPDIDDLNLTDHQKEKVKQALSSSAICILGGSPGTGKTWAVSEVVKRLGDSIGLDQVLVGGPTGKSAVRVTENLQAKGIGLRARTWASLLLQLEVKQKFFFDQKSLKGDESSMNDTDQMARVMRARPVGSTLLLVGDVNQLPPVGHGAPLRDLIAAGVAYGEFRDIIRNSGGIVEACAAIRDQQPWVGGDNLHLVETAEQHVEKIHGIYNQAKQAGLDPIWDVQVVVAVNEKSKLGRVELNKVLQSMLNDQPGNGDGRCVFRTGDKVVNTKNGFFKSLIAVDALEGTEGQEDLAKNEKKEVYVANGELAKVVSVDRVSMVCELDAPYRKIQVYFGDEGGSSFELGYALSVHKSQGSDWPWVIVVLDDYPGARMICDRSWLYTAISRAKQHCWLVGQKRVADRMCQQSHIWKRKTFLKELILAGRSRNGMAVV